MRADLGALLPRDKFDTERVEAIIALGFPQIEPVLPALLEWMQDINWPVAQALQPFLAKIGGALAPHIRHILESDDHTWKRWVIFCIIAESDELQATLRPELDRIANSPTQGEEAEELDVVARQILAGHASN